MRVSNTLPWVFLLIMSLVVVWLILVIATEDESREEYSNTTIAKTNEDAGFATIEIDETGTKVRGCKESE